MTGGGTLIHVEGGLDGESAVTLRRECRSAEGALRLDLSGLRWADREGIEALRSLAADGAELNGASSYIRLLLEEEAE
jgi:anti-anti-sigma regulatory factor